MKGPEYVANLEDRVRTLELLLGQEGASAVDGLEDDPTTYAAQAAQDLSSNLPRDRVRAATTARAAKQSNDRGTEPLPTSTDELSEKMGYLYLQANGEAEYMGASSSGTMIEDAKVRVKELLGNTSFEDFCHEALLVYAKNCAKNDSEVNRILSGQRSARPNLPPREACARYMEAYFAQVHHVFPVLNKKDFFERVEHVHDTVHFDPCFTCTYLMVLAFGSHIVYAQPPGKADSAGYHLFASAASLLYDFIHDVSLRVVQAQMLISLYMDNATLFTSLWHLFGAIVRKAQTLGLHRDIRAIGPNAMSQDPMAPAQIEDRRRTFWLLYIMDNNLTIGTGKPAALQDFDCDQALPISCNDSLQESLGLKLANGTAFSHLHAQIQLARISHQIQQRLFSVHAFTRTREEVSTIIIDLDQQLCDFWQNLPEEFRSRPDNRVAYLPSIYITHLIPLLQLHYHNLMITIHRRKLQAWSVIDSGPSVSQEVSDIRIRVSSSHAIAVQAARASLHVIASSPPQLGDACIQLKYQYPTMAAFVIFDNLVHNPGSPSAYEDLEMLKRLIRGQPLDRTVANGNIDLQQEFFTEVARVAEIALSNSSEQGMKRDRGALLDATPSLTLSSASSDYSHGPAYNHHVQGPHITGTQGVPVHPVYAQLPDTYVSGQVYEGGLQHPAIFPAAPLSLQGSGPTFESPAYVGGHMMPGGTGIVDPLACAPRVNRDGYNNNTNNTFDETLWKMSSLPASYGRHR